MRLQDISNARLISQQIAGTDCKTPSDIVSRMVAMQAQDFAMAKWAIGARLPGSTQAMIDQAIENGEIIRTHLLRPTWHFVAAADVYWLLELTAPHIKSAARARHKELELTEAVLKKSNTILEKALGKVKHLGRDELAAEFKKAKIATDNNRLSHIMMQAELEGIVCSGPPVGNKHTYALLAEVVPQKKELKREEALAELARRYFLGHGPATLTDFRWWSGLPAKDALNALELAKPHLISESIREETYWFGNSFVMPKTIKPSAYLLPAFDEFLISYADRSAALASEHLRKAFSSNGIFWPVIVINGIVKGLWKRTVKKDKVLIELELFESPDKKTEGNIRKGAQAFANFLEKEAELVFKENMETA